MKQYPNEQTAAVATRVRYRERQLLRTADLTAEQSYLIASRRRHNIGLHTWGIASGLQLSMRAKDLLVSPGLAIDGFGRELIVPDPVLVPESQLLNPGADALDVWLRYGLAQTDSNQPGSWDVGPGLYNRAQEMATIVVTAATGPVDPRSPGDVSVEDLQFSPDREPVDSPAQQWPVYIGRVQRPDAKSAFAFQPTDRAWCGSIGRNVVAPSGSAYIQIDDEIPQQPSRFAISTENSSGTLADRLTIDRDGDVVITGQVTLNDNLCIPEAPVDQSWGLGFKPAPVPASAKPWQIYRASVPVEGASAVEQLRIEMGSPDKNDDPASFMVSACFPTKPTAGFNHCLSVSADMTVRVSGTLKVEGKIIEGPIPVDSSDPRFREKVIGEWAGGVTAGAQSPLTATLTVEIGDIDHNEAKKPVKYTIAVANQGPGDVVSVHVFELLAVNGQIVEQAKDLEPKGFPLKVSGNRSFDDRTYTPKEAGEFAIAVTVIGVTTAGLTTQANARRVFNIDLPPQPPPPPTPKTGVIS